MICWEIQLFKKSIKVLKTQQPISAFVMEMRFWNNVFNDLIMILVTKILHSSGSHRVLLIDYFLFLAFYFK